MARFFKLADWFESYLTVTERSHVISIALFMNYNVNKMSIFYNSITRSSHLNYGKDVILSLFSVTSFRFQHLPIEHFIISLTVAE